VIPKRVLGAHMDVYDGVGGSPESREADAGWSPDRESVDSGALVIGLLWRALHTPDAGRAVPEYCRDIRGRGRSRDPRWVAAVIVRTCRCGTSLIGRRAEMMALMCRYGSRTAQICGLPRGGPGQPRRERDHRVIDLTFVAHLLRHLLDGVHDRGVIAVAKRLADRRQ